MSPERRILFVVTEDWAFWHHRLGIARTARDAGLSVHVATAPGKLGKDIEAEGFVYHPLRMDRGNLNPISELGTVFELVRLMRKVRPDMVDLRALKPILWGGVAARMSRVPAICCAVTGLGYVFLPGGLGKKVLRQVVNLVYKKLLKGRDNVAFIFQNPDDKKLFVQESMVDEAQCHFVNGAGVDTEAFTPSEEPPVTETDPFTILTPCRILWDKGIGEIVEASRSLKASGHEVRFRLVGEPDPANPASIPVETLQQWHDQGLVEWLGLRDDIPELIRASQVVCLPSYREGMPLACIEGSASGRAVITTDAPGCREVVQDGDNGLLVPVAESEPIAEAVLTLLQDPEKRMAMGRRGREIVLEKFDRRVVARQVLAVYRRLLGPDALPEPGETS